MSCIGYRMSSDSDPNVYLERCKLQTNQRILYGKKYAMLSKSAQNEIYYMKYCECLERQYTECLKHAPDLTRCNPIIDEYTHTSGLHTYRVSSSVPPS